MTWQQWLGAVCAHVRWGVPSPVSFGVPQLSMISHLPLFSFQTIVQTEYFPVERWLTVFKTKLGLGITVSSSLWSCQCPPCPPCQALVNCLLSEWKTPHNVLTTCLWHLLSCFFSRHVDFLAPLWFKLPFCAGVQDGGLGKQKEECSLHCPFQLWLKAGFTIYTKLLSG